MFYSIIACIILALFGGLNYYVGLRGWQFLGAKLHFIKVYWIVFSTIVLSSLVGVIGNRFLPDFLRSGLYTAGSYWLGALIYFILLLAAIDLIVFLCRKIGLLSKSIKSSSFFSAVLGFSIIVFVAALMVYGTWNARNIKIKSYNINIHKKLSRLDKLNIVMFSDSHLGYINDQRQKNIINAVNSLNPDIVLIPGDITDDIGLFEKYGIAEDFQKIKSKYGVYGSYGNHDYSIEDVNIIGNRLSKAGIKILRDNSVKVDESFYVIGREDEFFEMKSGRKRMELSKLIKEADTNLPIILLDHQPVDLDEAQRNGIDLQVSGHTHKGQIFPFGLITSKIFAVDYGYLKKGDFRLIVTSGAGTWGPPVRIGTSPEVVNIVVNFK